MTMVDRIKYEGPEGIVSCSTIGEALTFVLDQMPEEVRRNVLASNHSSKLLQTSKNTPLNPETAKLLIYLLETELLGCLDLLQQEFSDDESDPDSYDQYEELGDQIRLVGDFVFALENMSEVVKPAEKSVDIDAIRGPLAGQAREIVLSKEYYNLPYWDYSVLLRSIVNYKNSGLTESDLISKVESNDGIDDKSKPHFIYFVKCIFKYDIKEYVGDSFVDPRDS